MFLSKLKIKNFKNFKNFEIEFSTNKNLILGSEGKGKTTIFDIIYLLNFEPLYLTVKDYKKLISFNSSYSVIYGDVKSKNNENKLNWFKLKTLIKEKQLSFYKDEKILIKSKTQLNIFSFFVSLLDYDIFNVVLKQKNFFYQEILRNNLDYFHIKELFEKDFENWIEISSDKSKLFSINNVQKLEHDMIKRILMIKHKLKKLLKDIIEETKLILEKFENFSFLKKYFSFKKTIDLNFDQEQKELKNFWIKFRDDKFKKLIFFDFCFKDLKTFFDSIYLKTLSTKQKKISLIFFKLGAAKTYFKETKRKFVFCIDDFDIFSLEVQNQILKIIPYNICQLILFVGDIKKTFYIERNKEFDLFKI